MFRIATEPFLFLSFISYGTYITIVPQLLIYKVCRSNYHGDICSELLSTKYKQEEKLVYEEAAKWNTICFVSMSVPSLLFIWLAGALADIVGKKTLLLLPAIILTIQTMILMLTARFATSSMIFVVLAAALTSVYGDIQGQYMLAYSYMADATDVKEDRTVRMSVLGGLVYISIGVSSFVSGILLQNYGFVLALVPSLVASVTNFVFVAFILPDLADIPPTTGHPKYDEDFKERLSKFLKHFTASCSHSIMFFKKYLFSRKNKHIGLLLLATFFTSAAIIGENVFLVLFLKHRPLAMTAGEIGRFMLTLQCMSGFGVIILVFISMKFAKPSDAGVIITGAISAISTYVAIGLTTDKRFVLALTPLAIGFSFTSSGFKTMMTNLVGPNEHATALSCVAFVKTISLLAITLSCGFLFRATLTYFPGLSIISLAFACLIGLVVAIASFYCNPGCQEKPTESVELLCGPNFRYVIVDGNHTPDSEKSNHEFSY